MMKEKWDRVSQDAKGYCKYCDGSEQWNVLLHKRGTAGNQTTVCLGSLTITPDGNESYDPYPEYEFKGVNAFEQAEEFFR